MERKEKTCCKFIIRMRREKSTYSCESVNKSSIKFQKFMKVRGEKLKG